MRAPGQENDDNLELEEADQNDSDHEGPEGPLEVRTSLSAPYWSAFTVQLSEEELLEEKLAFTPALWIRRIMRVAQYVKDHSIRKVSRIITRVITISYFLPGDLLISCRQSIWAAEKGKCSPISGISQ